MRSSGTRLRQSESVSLVSSLAAWADAPDAIEAAEPFFGPVNLFENRVLLEPLVEPRAPRVEDLVTGLEKQISEIGGVLAVLGLLSILHERSARKSKHVELVSNDTRVGKVLTHEQLVWFAQVKA